ncbi:MCE family protein [Nocardia sp. NPDC055321]
MVVLLAGVVTICMVMFSGGFENTAKVTVAAPRAGLVLDPDAKVKIRGVEIGRVTGITNTSDGADIELAVDPEKLKMVPANALVDIRSTTVFGAKYINFVAPQNASGSLAPGATVRADVVTVEFNTIFQHLNDVLAMVQPEKLNATLTALGSALQGRGDQLGQTLVDAEAMLREINPSLPTLQEDLRKTTAVTGIYADTVPDLLRTTDNMQVTAATLVDKQRQLDAMLLGLTGLADTATPILEESTAPLAQALNLLKEPISTLHEYRSAIFCTLVGVGSNMEIVNDIFGGRYAAVTMNAGAMPGGEPYKYPQDLPKVNATGGPHCEGVLDNVPGVHPKYLVTDTAEGNVFQPVTEPYFNSNVFEWLFGGIPGVRK